MGRLLCRVHETPAGACADPAPLPRRHLHLREPSGPHGEEDRDAEPRLGAHRPRLPGGPLRGGADRSAPCEEDSAETNRPPEATPPDVMPEQLQEKMRTFSPLDRLERRVMHRRRTYRWNPRISDFPSHWRRAEANMDGTAHHLADMGYNHI